MSFRDIPAESRRSAGIGIQNRASFTNFLNMGVTPKTSIIAGGVSVDVASYTAAEIAYFADRAIPSLILYSNDEMETELKKMPNMTIVSGRNKVYKPFGGMDESGVINFISRLCDQLNRPQCADTLAAYVKILNLSGMAITYLNLKTLIYRSSSAVENLVNSLGIGYEQKRILAAYVRNKNSYIGGIERLFADIESGLGIIADAGTPSTNILNTILRGRSIAINMNTGNDKIMQMYLHAVLDYCTGRTSDFAVVIYEVSISNEGLKNLISRSNAVRYKIFAGHAPEEMTAGELNMKTVDFMLLLNGLNPASASTYEEMFPELDVTVINRSSGSGRQFISLLPEHFHNTKTKTKQLRRAIPGKVISELEYGQAILADFSLSRYLAVRKFER